MGILEKVNGISSKPTADFSNEIITPTSAIGKQILRESTTLNEYLPYYKDIESKTDIRINKIADPNDLFSEYESELERIAREEEIAKAKNQSNWEKAYNSLAQLVVDEIILGSLEGIGNLVELAVEGTDTDYSNAFSNWMRDLQESHREFRAIHRENPNESWDVGDFGWWAEGLVSVGSFASMLLPAAGTTKLLGTVGKATKLNKVTTKGLKLLANTGNRVQKGKKLLFRPNLASKNLQNIISTATTATLSRLGESFIESKDTYDYVYDGTLNKLKSFDDTQRKEFYENNPQYVNMSDEDIARDLAKLSADDNFSDDMKLVVLDFIQIRGLSKIWQNQFKNLTPNAATRIAHRNSLRKLQGLGEESYEAINMFTKGKEWLRYNIKHPITWGTLENLSEGFEEGYQGVVQDKAKDYYRMAFDPSYTPRTLDSYLSDGHIWEQAFWGVVGAVGIKGLTHVGSSIKDSYNTRKENKNLTSERQQQRLTNEKVREQVINDRFEKMNDYVEKMKSLNAGRHYSEYENTGDENTAPEFKKLTEEEVLLEKQKLTNEFITDFGFNAIENGTFDLTKEFFESEYFNKYLKEAGLQETDVDRYLNKNISEQLEKVKNKYDENFQLFLNNIDYGTANDKELAYSIHLLKMAARNVTRLEMDIDTYENINKDIDNSISDLGYAEALSDGRYSKILNTTIKEAVDIFDTQIAQYEELYNKGKISKSARDQYINDINDKKVEVLGLMSKITSNDIVINDLVDRVKKIKNDLSKTKTENKTTSIKTALADYNDILKQLDAELSDTVMSDTLPADIEEELRKKANNYLRMSLEKSQIPTNKEGLVETYKELAYGFDKYTTDRINNAFKLVGDYIEQSENPEQAYKDLLSEKDDLSKKMKDALEVLKLGYDSAFDFNRALQKIVKDTRQKLDADKASKEKVQIDNKEITDVKKQEEINNTVKKTTDVIQNSDTENEEISEELSPEEKAVADLAEQMFEERESIDTIDETYYNGESEDYRIKNYISDFIIKHSRKKEFLKIIEEIKTADMSDPNFKLLYNTIVNEFLKEYSMSIEEASLIAKQEIHSVLTLLAQGNMQNPNKRQKFITLAKQLSHQIEIQKDGDLFSVTSLIEDTEENKKAKIDLIKQFILSYRELYNIQGDVLNVDEFFTNIFENEEIDYSTAVNIFNYFDLIYSEKIIKTTNDQLYRDSKKDTSFYFSRLIEQKQIANAISNFMHVSKSNAKDSDTQKIINDALEKARTGAKVTIQQGVKNSLTLSIMCDGIEIAFISKVKTNSTRTQYEAERSREGLNWIVSIDSDGNVTSNYDKLFKALKEQNTEEAKVLFNIIYGHAKENKPIDNTVKDELKILFSKLGYYELSDKLNDKIKDKTIQILKDIESVIFNKDCILKESDIYYKSYQNWIDKIYDNYSKTYEIEQQLLEGKELIVDIKQIGYIKPHFTTNKDVSSQPFNSKDFTIFGIDKEGRPITETTKEHFAPTTIFNRGEMGILLNNFNGNPIIAKFNESNTVSSSEVLHKLVSDELNKILTDYFQNNINYEELYQELKEILVTNPLFYGYKLIRSKHGVLVTKGSVKYWTDNPNKADKNIVLAIYNENKNGKETRAMTVFNKDGKPYRNEIDTIQVPYSEYNPKYINRMVKELVNGLYFNKSLMPLNQKSKRNYKDNKHFYKENGKLVLEFGNTKLEYNNYLDFIMAHNCFKVNVQADSNGNFFFQNYDDKGIYIDVKHYTLDDKSDIDIEKAKNNAIGIIEKATKSKSASVKDILSAFGYDNNYIDALINPLPGTNIKLINDKVYYDKDINAKYDANFSKGKVTISSRGINQIRKNPNNLIRLLAHENLHRHVEKLKAVENEYIINDLLDTYNQFIKAIEKDALAGKKEAILLKRWIEQNNFKPNNQFIKDDVNNVIFAQEWLVESLTRPEIAEYLNNTLYEGDIDIDTKMNLFQKILQAFLELIGINLHNFDQNSILAKQITIFNTPTENKITPIKVNEDNEATISPPVEETPQQSEIVQQEDNEANGDVIPETEKIFDEAVLTEEELAELEDDSDFYSSTLDIDNNITLLEHNLNQFADNPNVNPNGYTMVSNMQKFIDQYPPKYRSILQQELDNGTLNFICQ